MARVTGTIEKQSAFLLLLAGALIVGSILRLFGLSDQIISGDEWHAIHMALDAGFGEIASTFGAADHSIPVSLYYKLLADTVGLQQWMIQLPFAFAGCAVIVVFPWLCRRFVGLNVASLTALFLSCSPFLILSSRIARPYPIALLLGCCALVFFYRWWRDGKHTDAALYTGSAVLACYFLLPVAPLVLSPFLIMGGCASVRYISGRDMKRLQGELGQLTLLGLCVSLLFALLLGPALINDWGSLAGKSGGGRIAPVTLVQVLHLFTGAAGYTLTSLSFALCLIGLFAAGKERQQFVLFLVACSATHFLTITALSPTGTDAFFILGRYLIFIVPVMAVLWAMGILKTFAWLGQLDQVKLQGAFACLIVLATLLFGPVPKSFPDHVAYNLLAEMMRRVEGIDPLQNYVHTVSPFYQELAREGDEELRLVEAPFIYNADYIPLLQSIHGQHTAMGYIGGLCSADRSGEIPLEERDRFQLNHFYYLAKPGAMHDDGIDYVVFHTDLQNEIPLLATGIIQLADCLDQYRNWYGAPVFSDATISVFALTPTSPRS